jgi:hypothetical protein
VLEVGRMLDRLAQIRASGAPSVRDEVALSRQLASLLAQLRIET